MVGALRNEALINARENGPPIDRCTSRFYQLFEKYIEWSCHPSTF